MCVCIRLPTFSVRFSFSSGSELNLVTGKHFNGLLDCMHIACFYFLFVSTTLAAQTAFCNTDDEGLARILAYVKKNNLASQTAFSSFILPVPANIKRRKSAGSG